MTGEKNRYKTHEQLWKLEDGDLSTPQHDELVLQLLYKKNAIKLFSLVYGVDPDFIDESDVNIESELPITSKTDFIIGYIDIAISVSRRDSTPIILFVEVKPKIKSFGETLRQLKTYMNYRKFNYVVYSPDISFRNAFQTQKIGLFSPSDLGLK